MYPDLLPYLRCPVCHARLCSQPSEVDPAGDIVAGALSCVGCGARYPVRSGIADFLGSVRPATPAQVVNDWPITGWGYERLWRPFALTLLSNRPFPYWRELRLIAALTEPQRGGLYVDVACSNGLYARALARAMRCAPGHVAGVDHSFSMLVEARRFARVAELRISYVRAEAQALPIMDGAAAGVVIGGSLNEIGDLDRCLSEVRRTLAPRGRYVGMSLTQAATALGRALQRVVGSGGIRFWTPKELVGHFERHGLRNVGRWSYGVVLFTLCVPT